MVCLVVWFGVVGCCVVVVLLLWGFGYSIVTVVLRFGWGGSIFLGSPIEIRVWYGLGGFWGLVYEVVKYISEANPLERKPPKVVSTSN